MTDPMQLKPLDECKAALEQLQALLREGRADGPEYRAICAAMEKPWYALTPEEQEEAGRYSEELYRRDGM